jgi:hypothetical protein
MRLVQFLSPARERQVGLVEEDGATLRVVRDTSRIYDLALEAWGAQRKLEQVVLERLGAQTVDYGRVLDEKRLRPPLDHPDPAHCYVSGTGLTHLGSARARDEMHVKSDEDASTGHGEAVELTDSMRMFQWGLEGGKPPAGQVSVQPEWFYKGNGNCIVPPEGPLELPPFALDGGEEAEMVGLYVIAPSGAPFGKAHDAPFGRAHGAVLRVGFALGNEFSDNVMERQNYLYLAHSKMRTCSMGPELRVGPLPSTISGRVRVLRAGGELWADTFLTGEDNMSYTIANLEHHHFKYAAFREPGDVHCHFFGTATLSSAAGVVPQPGDLFEISAPEFGRALRNPLVRVEEPEGLVSVQAL